MFVTLLSILPKNLPPVFRWLQPYVESLASPPRQAVVNTAVRGPAFISAWSTNVLKACKRGQQYQALTSYWATITSDAVIGQLEQNTSGRKEARRQSEEDILLRMLPILNDGLSLQKVPDMRIGCYMVLIVLASKIDLQDSVLMAMMEAVGANEGQEISRNEIVCLAVLAQRLQTVTLPMKVYKGLKMLNSLEGDLVALCEQYDIGDLCFGLGNGVLKEIETQGEPANLGLIVRLAEKKLLAGSHLSATILAILQVADDINNHLDSNARGRLGDLVLRLAESETTGETVRKTIEQTGIDVEQLEAKVQTTLLPTNEKPLSTFEVELEDVKIEGGLQTYEALKNRIPTRTAYEVSFLSSSPSYVFDSLYQAFTMACKSAAHLHDFSDLPVLRKSLSSTEPLFFSFFIRVWCGPHQANTRTAALVTVRDFIQTSSLSTDPQVLLPYIIYALADPSTQVRRAATDLAISLRKTYDNMDRSSSETKVLGADSIYGDGHSKEALSLLSLDEVCTVLDRVLTPNLEECRLDSEHISRILTHALSASHEPKNPEVPKKGLKASTRSSFLFYVGSHIIHTSLLRVKARLLKVIGDVGKVGSTSKSKVLDPLLRSFEAMNEQRLREKCTQEQIEESNICSEVISTVSASDREGIRNLHRILLGQEIQPPSALREAAVKRVRSLWSSMKTDGQIASIQTLLLLTNSLDKLSEDASETVRQLSLSTTVAIALLKSMPPFCPDTKEEPTITKRRRTSHGHVDGEAGEPARAYLQSSLHETTTILQLVEGSPQSNGPELAGPLFLVLEDMYNVKKTFGIDFNYTYTVLFNCLFESVERARKAKSTLDSHAIRADLVVDCFRTTTSTQVQQASLLLMSSLSAIAPDLIVHSVMPIFTFMGSNMLRLSDDYSAHVIERTIESVIPPLIESFRKGGRGPLAGVSELLLSFVAAFDHIPVHRRLDLFSALIERLGAEDFLFALLVLLADRYGTAQAPTKFAAELCGRYSCAVQLKTVDRYIEVVLDTLKPKPTSVSQHLVSHENGRNKASAAVALLQLPAQLLRAPRLTSTIVKLLVRDDKGAEEIRSTYSHLVRQTLALSTQSSSFKKLPAACDLFLDALLGLLPIDESIRSLEHLLADGDEGVKRQVLKSLDKRISSIRAGSQTSQRACLSFLPRLQTILSTSSDELLKQTSLACMDRIAERFGKTNPNEMETIAKEVSSANGLGALEINLRVMSLICLTTLVEVLGDAIVPVIPTALPLTLSQLDETIKTEQPEERLYNAAFSFFGSLLLYVPWMVNGEYLDRLIRVSEASSNKELSDKCDGARRSTLELISKQVSPQECFTALRRTWLHTVSQGPDAVGEHLMMLRIAVERHSKSVIVKNSSLLASLCLEVLGLRCHILLEETKGYDDEDLREAETDIGEIMIKVIYKLNDTHFRPIFVKMLYWANDASSKKAKQGRLVRQASLYGFLHTFFETLKSIVTSYSGVIVENAVEALNASSPSDTETSLLWHRVLSTLQSAFEHDQDDFWQSPSRFGPASEALLAQFEHSGAEEPAAALTTCLTSFASAADSGENLKAINAGIMKHMRAESWRVRLAAVRCEISITEALGEEWLSLLPEMLPFISEAMEDDDEEVEMEVRRWVRNIEAILGESLDTMLQ